MDEAKFWQDLQNNTQRELQRVNDQLALDRDTLAIAKEELIALGKERDEARAALAKMQTERDNLNNGWREDQARWRGEEFKLKGALAKAEEQLSANTHVHMASHAETLRDLRKAEELAKDRLRMWNQEAEEKAAAVRAWTDRALKAEEENARLRQQLERNPPRLVDGTNHCLECDRPIDSDEGAERDAAQAEAAAMAQLMLDVRSKLLQSSVGGMPEMLTASAIAMIETSKVRDLAARVTLLEKLVNAYRHYQPLTDPHVVALLAALDEKGKNDANG